MNHGWSGSSTISTSCFSGHTPETRKPFLAGLPVLVRDLVPVPVPLQDLRGPVLPSGQRVLGERDGVEPEPHGAALVLDRPLIRQDVDDGMGGAGVELRRVGLGQAGHVPSELDHRTLGPQADAEEGHSALPRVLRGLDLAWDAPVAEAAGDQDAVDPAEVRVGPIVD